ncbi:GTP cyclohydrolase III (methanopterin) [Chitinispirillum alkaliphilum]|nr:GTP cyclohydrolase III (methanopterin) [Chitinispirillum alkaliphilum]
MIKSFTFLFVIASIALLGCGSSEVEKGNICLKLGDYEMAEYFFHSALLKNPADYQARLGMGKTLLQRAHVHTEENASLWQKGLLHLEAAQNINPGGELKPLLSEIWNKRATHLLKAGDTSEALRAVTRSIEYNSENVDALNSAGIIYFRLGEVTRSKEIFQRAVNIDSLNAALLFNLGLIHYELGETPQAHKWWLLAVKIEPEDEDILYWFAVAESEMRSVRKDD